MTKQNVTPDVRVYSRLLRASGVSDLEEGRKRPRRVGRTDGAFGTMSPMCFKHARLIFTYSFDARTQNTQNTIAARVGR